MLVRNRDDLDACILDELVRPLRKRGVFSWIEQDDCEILVGLSRKTLPRQPVGVRIESGNGDVHLAHS